MIIDEAVLHRQVGGPKVIRDQVEHMIRCITEDRVILQVLPFEAGAHAGMNGNFTVLHFEAAEAPDLVYVEGRTGDLFLNRPVDLTLHRDTFDHLRATAESPDRSLDRMQQLLNEMPG